MVYQLSLIDNRLQFPLNTSSAGNYEKYDMQGRVIKKGSVNSEETIDVSELVPGVYLVKLNVKGVVSNPQKIIKFVTHYNFIMREK